MTQSPTQRSYVQFNKGILTERSEVSFPEGYSVDELNMDPQIDGSIKRRLGAALETGTNDFAKSPYIEGQSITTHEWTNVANDPSKAYTIVQNGLNLHFYDNNSTSLGSSTVSGFWSSYDLDGNFLSSTTGDTFAGTGTTFIDARASAVGSRDNGYANDHNSLKRQRDPVTRDVLTNPYANRIGFGEITLNKFFQSLAAENNWMVLDKEYNVLADKNTLASIAVGLDAVFPFATFPAAAKPQDPQIFILNGWMFFDFCGSGADPTDGILIGWNYRTNDVGYFIHGSNNISTPIWPLKIRDDPNRFHLTSVSGWRGDILFGSNNTSFTMPSFYESYLNSGLSLSLGQTSDVPTLFSPQHNHTWYSAEAYSISGGRVGAIAMDAGSSNIANASYSTESIHLAQASGSILFTTWMDDVSGDLILYSHNITDSTSKVHRFHFDGTSISLVWTTDITTLTGLSLSYMGSLTSYFYADSPRFVYLHGHTNNYAVVNIETGSITESGTTPSASTFTNYDDGFTTLTRFHHTVTYDPYTRKVFNGTAWYDVNTTSSGVTLPVDQGSYWENAHEFPLQYANSNGEVIIASPGIQTTRIIYKPDEGTFELRPIKFQNRDFSFANIRDRYISERPLGDFSAAVAYDIINHGWHGKNGGSALERYIAARGLLPPLSLRWYASKDEFSKFDVAGFFDLAGGTSLVTSGHFLLELYSGDRNIKLSTSPFNPNWNYYAGNQSETTELNNYDYATQNPETNSTMQAVKLFAGSADLKSKSTGNGTITGQTNSRFYNFNSYVAATPTFTAYLERLLGKEKASWQIKDFQDSAGTAQGQIFDYLRMYETRYYVTPVVGGIDLEPVLPTVDGDLPEFTSAEFNADALYAIDVANRLGTFVNKFSGVVDSIPETTRFRTVANFANRIFYSGLTSQRNTSNLYFSQLLADNNNDAGRCYQEADPTSENFSDLLPTDGGVLKINGAYNIQKLHAMKDRLLVLAENGVWSIRGIDGAFSATGFVVEKISDVGLSHVNSFVSANGRPYWFSDQGIYTLQFSQESGTLDVSNMSDLTIKTFYEGIDPRAKDYAKGFYDKATRKIFWMYGNGASPDWEYNNFLIFDEQVGSFTPWTISDQAGTSPKIVGLITRPGLVSSISELNVVDTSGNVILDSSGNQVTVSRETYTISNLELSLVCRDTNDNFSFGFFNGGTYLDWGTTSYNSYIETPYDFMGDMTTKKQGEYCTIYTRVTETGFELDGNGNLAFSNPSGGMFSCYWDFRTDASMTDQVFYRLKRYPVPGVTGPVTMPTTVTSSRMRLKGRGRILRLRFDAETGKEMYMVGYEMIGLKNGRY